MCSMVAKYWNSIDFSLWGSDWSHILAEVEYYLYRIKATKPSCPVTVLPASPRSLVLCVAFIARQTQPHPSHLATYGVMLCVYDMSQLAHHLRGAR